MQPAAKLIARSPADATGGVLHIGDHLADLPGDQRAERICRYDGPTADASCAKATSRNVSVNRRAS